MNPVNTNISDLLYEYECVVVPGFGGFVTNYKSAEMNGSAVMYPPSRDLGFVDVLTVDDGVLVGRLTQKNGGSYQEALGDIEAFTHDCLKILNHREAIYVPKVGEIKADTSGNLQFQAENTNFLADAFGLPELHLTPLEKPKALEPIQAPVPAPIIKSETRNMAKSSFSLLNIIVLAGVVMLGFMLWNRYQDRKNTTPDTEERIPISDDDREGYYDEPEDLGVIDTDDEALDPSLRETTDTYIDDINETSEPVTIVDEPVIVVPRETIVIEEAPPKKTTPAPKRTYSSKKRRYTVVVGSFSNGDFANDMMQRCKRAGYEVETSWKGGMKRVGVILYCPPNELNSRLKKVQNQFNQDAWVVK